MKFYINGKEINWEPKNLIIAGYTAKDQDALRAHIEELEKIGVPAPQTVPMIYQLSPELLSTETEISTVRNDSSGEVEVVLLNIEGEWYVGIGSDHTDRVLEAVSIQKSKQVCAKPISKELWPLSSIEDHWDDLQLKSWYSVNGEVQLYQSGKLEEFLSPKELIEIVEARDYLHPKRHYFAERLRLYLMNFFTERNLRQNYIMLEMTKKLSYPIKLKY